MGTVDTTVMSRATSQGPRSIPERTSERGAGTRHAPEPHASHISSHDASKATDNPASTRSPGPRGRSCRNSRDSASTNAAALRLLTATPFGVPVEPDVKITHASSSIVGCPTGRPVPTRPVPAMPPSVTIAVTPASENTRSARSSGSSTSTGTYAAPAAITDRMAAYRP